MSERYHRLPAKPHYIVSLLVLALSRARKTNNRESYPIHQGITVEEAPRARTYKGPPDWEDYLPPEKPLDFPDKDYDGELHDKDIIISKELERKQRPN